MIEINQKKRILSEFNFIDLFAGIGGFHYAMSSFGANCAFASEIDKKAADNYYINHGIRPFGDITKIRVEDIPSHNILCAGFPCQSFSISGKQKGFNDIRGTLFFDIVRIADHHKPEILFLENVKNFERHDNGRTLSIVNDTLRLIGYKVYSKVLNASDFGLPQNRERIYIIAFRNDIDSKCFKFPIVNIISSLYDILDTNPLDGKIIDRNDIKFYKDFQPLKNLFGDVELPNKPIQIGIVNKGGQGERIYDPWGHSITLSANGGGVGAKTGLYRINDTIRKLSPKECARLQGFPETHKISDTITESYRQFGNSVPINVLQYIIENFSTILYNHGHQTRTRIANSKRRIQKRKNYSVEIQ